MCHFAAVCEHFTREFSKEPCRRERTVVAADLVLPTMQAYAGYALYGPSYLWFELAFNMLVRPTPCTHFAFCMHAVWRSFLAEPVHIAHSQSAT